MLHIFIVFFITVTLRLLLAYQTSDSLLHTLDGEYLSILTPDAALYGHYAKLLLAGLPHENDVHLIEYVIYFLVKVTPFSLDQIMYFLPAFLSSLVVVPAMLIARLYIDSKNIVTAVGLIAGVGYGYYSRTYLGYCDTDMLNLFFPMMMLYGMVLSVKKEDYNYTLITVISNILYIVWYHSSLPLVYAMNGFFVIYALVFHLKNTEFYKISILLGLSIIGLAFWYKAALLIALFIGFRYLHVDYRYFLSLFVIAFLFVLYKIDINQFSFHAQRYIFKSQTIDSSGFNFVAPMQYVAEAGSFDIMHIANRISGNIFIFILSLIGYGLLVFRHKEMLLALPLVVLGVLSIKAGVRFHIYAVAVLALSYMYTAFYLIQRYELKKYAAYALVGFLFFLAAFENYKSIEFWNTKVAKPVFYPEQVKALKHLEKIKSPNSYAIAWWDYGWPLWYYSGLNTMIDNGRHHADNYTVASILLSPSQRLTHHGGHYFYDIFDKNKKDAITQALKQESDAKKLFEKIYSGEIKTQKKVDKYIILPIQMSRLLYTIYNYANIDPKSGKKISNNLFKKYIKLKEDDNFIYFNKDTKLDKRKSTLIKGNQEIKIKRFSEVAFKNGMKMKREADIFDDGLNLVNYLDSYYVIDDFFYNSTVVQMLFFNNYDKEYFEPVYMGQSISIYKLK